MNTPQQLRDNLAYVEEQVTAACRRTGRQREEVRVMAVTKMHPVAAITEAAALGIALFGENKVQEYQAKNSALAPLLEAHKIAVHLIGHLQSNKAARAVELFSSIDTLDSPRLAERLNDAAVRQGRMLPVLLEIKLSGEESKSGLDPHSTELAQLLERVPDLRNLQLRGFMTVPPYLRDAEAVRPWFRELRELRDQLAPRHPRLSFDALSMGMSHDYAVAIEEGATEIRLGTALFGARDYTQ